MVQFSEGVKLRTQIGSEVVRGLTLANGGGAVAFIALLPNLLTDYPTLAKWTVWGLLGMFLGLASAILHNRFRRHCSLAYETAWRQGGQPVPGKLLGRQLKVPTVCGISELFLWLSVGGFIYGGMCVFIGGLFTIYG
jgi:hypothetical protein